MMDFLSHLPSDDIIFTHIFPHLSVKDLYKLRDVSMFYEQLVVDYFRICIKYDFSKVEDKPIAPEDIFRVATKDNTCIQTLLLPNARHWLTDQLLINVIENCQYLKHVDISKCTQLSNKCLHAISINCPSLTYLSLGGCLWVDKENLLNLVRSCPDLEHIDVSSCWDLDDACMVEVALMCPKLKVMDVSGIYSITDSLLETIAQTCPSLTTLGVKGCWRVSNSGIRLVGEYCKDLRELRVNDCRSVTEASLARLRVRGVKVDVPASTWEEIRRLSNTFPYARPCINLNV